MSKLSELNRCPFCRSADIYKSGHETLPYRCHACGKLFIKPVVLERMVSGDRVGKVLEQVAREISDLNKHDVIVVEALAVLEERLGPLLRAGQAMRDALDVHVKQCHAGMHELAEKDLLEPWDAALAALEREPGL